MDVATLPRKVFDGYGFYQRSVSGFLEPRSADELADIFARASEAGVRVAMRGAGLFEAGVDIGVKKTVKWIDQSRSYYTGRNGGGRLLDDHVEGRRLAGQQAHVALGVPALARGRDAAPDRVAPLGLLRLVPERAPGRREGDDAADGHDHDGAQVHRRIIARGPPESKGPRRNERSASS